MAGPVQAERECAPCCALVIFGAGGDLTKRLVVPALYNLARQNLLPERLAIVGFDHNERTDEEWRKHLLDFLKATVKSGDGEFEADKIDMKVWKRLADAMSYVTGDFTKAASFAALRKHLAGIDRENDLGGNAVFYLAVADRFFGEIVDQLGKTGLTDDGKGWRRVVIEKPFGHDLKSARELNDRILQSLREDQIYRIDHFLGKETVQNIMAFRFANGLFEPLWNRQHIDHVQITVSESIGIEGRGRFYEHTGALRDMIPNHLFQLVAMTAMEPPVSFNADDVRARKAEVFKSTRPLSIDEAVRGQYGPGRIDGQDVPGYRQEENVDPQSAIETFAAMRLSIENWRWAGVPFYLRTGKRLPRRYTEIAIRFRDAPFMLFNEAPVDSLAANWMILLIQPDEGIRLHFSAKRPGPVVALDTVSMDFEYSDWFKQAPAVGYETLLYDCFMGDATLFQRADQVEAAWAVVDPVLKAWDATKPQDFPNYEAGSAGPDCADQLLARDGRAWRTI